MLKIKCKQCRKDLFSEEPVKFFTAHGDLKHDATHMGCTENELECCLYMSEENVSKWIQNAIEQEYWTKGRLYCPFCNNRLGSFNLICQQKCNCGKYITPPIRLNYSKVDLIFDIT